MSDIKIEIVKKTWNDEFESVSKDIFDAYIKNYPRPLERNVHLISEPATISFNDFELAPKWPESMVARHVEDETGPYGYEIRKAEGEK